MQTKCNKLGIVKRHNDMLEVEERREQMRRAIWILLNLGNGFDI